ncbi:hypothetical protein B0H10DRAFT_1993357 [Mycena sp. CBHHK59/15]|nr:hypothetical protein B0H10DRAFT_1993357 [Mycena sp. CBHHK59/15]
MSDSESEEESIYTNPKLFFDSLPAHMRPKEIFSPEEATKRADIIRRNLFASWSRLKAVVLAHEDTISKRWKKRTSAKRRQFLSEVEPTLPKEHAPEVSAFMQNAGQYATLQDKRDNFLFPYLNLDDLSINNGTQFLGLLHARAHRFPSEFVLFDEDTIHFGIVAGGIQRYHGFDCAMVIFGNEDTYGRVLEYSERLNELDENSPDGGAMEHLLRESMTFGNGLVVLETQGKLMNFLLAVVSKILSDLDLTVLTPAPPIPAPVIPILNTTFQWKSSARVNAMRPYGSPPVFSIDDIATLMDSQYELAAQHLGDLRTDPMYLAETLQSYYDHRIETILNKAPPPLIQNRATTLMLTDAYSFLAYYHIAKAIIDDFRVVQKSFPNGVARARELPKEYENALIKLHPIFELLEHRVSKVHHQTICASAALRDSCSVRSNDPSFAKHQLAFTPKRGDKLFTYLTVLLQEDQTHLWQITRLFDGIDRTTEDATEHRRVSPLLANLLSQWGVINDCKSILELHRPAVQSEGMEHGMSRLKEWHSLIGPINEVTGPGAEFNLGDKTFPVAHFVYPKGPRDAAWVRRCQHVDDTFAAFWTAADRMMTRRCGKELFDLGVAVVAPFGGMRTDWAALLQPKVGLERRKPSPGALLPFGGVAQVPVGAREEAPAVKLKPKTRGVTAGEVEADTEHLDSRDDVPAVRPTPVSTRAYKVFATLFNAAKDEEIALQHGSVPWKDIQTAFAQLDFALQKTRGSAWTFRHPDGCRSITVHEPHPEATMRFWDARRFGRRLTRRFGWTLDSFLLDPKMA